MTRPVELKPEKIIEACRKAQGHLAVVEANANLIARRGNEWCGEAISGRSYDGVNRGGNDDTHPEREAGKADPVAANHVEFHRLCLSILRDAARLRDLGDALHLVIKIKETDEVEGESRSVGAGDCVNCSRYCVGLRDDRLKSGRCEACYVYRLRHETERPRELWEEQRESVA